MPSLLAAIGDVIEKHMIAIGFLQKQDGAPEQKAAVDESALQRGCPRCGHRALIRQEGCDTCTDCGYSRCD